MSITSPLPLSRTESMDLIRAPLHEAHAENELTTDEIYHLLQNERRRNVLRYLQGTTDPVRMRDVAEQVAAWEHDTTVAGLSSDQRQRVYIPLYQSHLPKLDKAGVIRYQQSRGIVERTPMANQLDPYLEAEAETSTTGSNSITNSWTDSYIGATTVGAILLAGSIFELPIFSTISSITIALIILLLFTTITIGRRIKT